MVMVAAVMVMVAAVMAAAVMVAAVIVAAVMVVGNLWIKSWLPQKSVSWPRASTRVGRRALSVIQSMISPSRPNSVPARLQPGGDLLFPALARVRSWHLLDMATALSDVRFQG